MHAKEEMGTRTTKGSEYRDAATAHSFICAVLGMSLPKGTQRNIVLILFFTLLSIHPSTTFLGAILAAEDAIAVLFTLPIPLKAAPIRPRELAESKFPAVLVLSTVLSTVTEEIATGSMDLTAVPLPAVLSPVHA